MDWSEDLGGLKLRMRRESESPQDIVLEFDVHDKALLTKKPLLYIRVTTQRLKHKWQGVVFKGGNWDTTTIFRAALPIDTPGQTFVLKNQPFYDFKGEEIESFCIAELSHTDATGEQRVPNALPYPISELNDAASIVDPKDLFDSSGNFERLPRQTKINTYLLQALLAGLLAWTLNWGVSEEVWFWGRGEKKGGAAVLWGFALVCMLGGIFKVRKNALSKYMSVEKSKASKLKVEPGKNYALADIIDGEVQIDIQNALFRIVCCNRERFQYLESGGQQREWVPRYRDFNGHVLYERTVSRIPAGSRLADYLPKRHDISFDAMFSNLYPQALVSKNFGVSVYWEVQVIHDELVDLEIPIAGIDRDWPFEYFASDQLK